jgi:hypothetical protein
LQFRLWVNRANEFLSILDSAFFRHSIFVIRHSLSLAAVSERRALPLEFLKK